MANVVRHGEETEPCRDMLCWSAPACKLRKGGLLWHAQNALSDLVGNGSQNTTTGVEEIVDNPMITDVYGEKAFNCAVRNHEKNLMNERFIATMLKAWKK